VPLMDKILEEREIVNEKTVTVLDVVVFDHSL
jgi:hypothetical protein